MNRYGKQSYHAVFFGGDPLLNFDLIKYIVPILKNDSRCKMIIALTNGIAFKDEDIRNYFMENRLGFSLSFDGL